MNMLSSIPKIFLATNHYLHEPDSSSHHFFLCTSQSQYITHCCLSCYTYYLAFICFLYYSLSKLFFIYIIVDILFQIGACRIQRLFYPQYTYNIFITYLIIIPNYFYLATLIPPHIKKSY